MRVSPVIGRTGASFWQSGEIVATQRVNVPAGFSSVCMVTVGVGQAATNTRSGNGGCLRYANDVPCNPEGDYFDVEITATYTRILNSAAVVVCRANSGSGGTSSMVGIGFNGGTGASVSSNVSRQGAGVGGYTSVGQSTTTTDNSNGGGGIDLYGRRLAGGDRGGNNVAQGQDYGGGGGNRYNSSDGSRVLGGGGIAGARIIAGPLRAFPNTLTEDL